MRNRGREGERESDGEGKRRMSGVAGGVEEKRVTEMLELLSRWGESEKPVWSGVVGRETVEPMDKTGGWNRSRETEESEGRGKKRKRKEEIKRDVGGRAKGGKRDNAKKKGKRRRRREKWREGMEREVLEEGVGGTRILPEQRAIPGAALNESAFLCLAMLSKRKQHPIIYHPLRKQPPSAPRPGPFCLRGNAFTG